MEKQTTVDRLGEIYSVHDPVRDKREMYVHRIPGKILKIGVGPSGAPFPLSSPLHFFFRPMRQPTVYIVFSRTGEYDLSNVSNENGEGGGGGTLFNFNLRLSTSVGGTTILSNEIFRLRDTHTRFNNNYNNVTCPSKFLFEFERCRSIFSREILRIFEYWKGSLKNNFNMCK